MSLLPVQLYALGSSQLSLALVTTTHFLNCAVHFKEIPKLIVGYYFLPTVLLHPNNLASPEIRDDQGTLQCTMLVHDIDLSRNQHSFEWHFLCS